MSAQTRKHKIHGIEVEQISICYALSQKVMIHPSGCWLWTGAKTPSGYGKINRNGRFQYVHRFAYEMAFGAIPTGLEIDHLCGNRSCVNPSHLEPVTRQENITRSGGASSVNASKTHCTNGHIFDEENTRFDSDGHRRCRICNRAWRRQTYERKHHNATA